MFVNGYPYTDFHELNLDAIIKKMGELMEDMKNFKATESLKFAEPIIWDITTQYQKSTIVLDPTGNAYLSLQPVPAGVQLNDTDYWLEIFNFTEYTRTANQNLTVNVETNTTRATHAYNVDDWLIWNDVLYKVTTSIAIDDALVVGTNIVHFTVEDFLKAFITYVNNLILQYKNDIDASELAFTNYLEQQFNQVISGATVDSEVINSRVMWNGIEFNTLKNNNTSQFQTLYNMHSDKMTPQESMNLFNHAYLATGAIDADGTENWSINYKKSIYFQEVEDTYIICNYAIYVCTYDSTFTFISRILLTANTAASLPANTKYIRYIAQNATVDAADIILANHNYVPEYTPFIPKLVNTDIPAIDDTIHEYLIPTYTDNILDTQKAVAGYGISPTGAIISTASYYTVFDFVEIEETSLATNYFTFAAFYDANKDFMSRVTFTSGSPATVPTGAKYVRFMIERAIAIAHPDDHIVVNAATLPGHTAPSVIYKMNKRIACKSVREPVYGKNFLIYKFGGEGNDWCFVRTPANYDPTRKQPYKFVICNHGNGITMNGNKINATYTKRLMYLDPDDPNFDSSLDMIATTDPELQYSNPVFEKFLDEGWIVCGCENYADALYGNEDCRRACVDFFNHMIEKYNVVDYCYMIGASNGALTSINAAYYLKEKVRAMILQYPLTCLVNQYFAYSPHRAGIRTAYGISDLSPTQDELIEDTLTHDIMYVDNIDDKLMSYFPATKLYYSNGDTTVPSSANAVPFISLLSGSKKIVDSYVGTGNHGDPSLFDPTGFYDFLSAH